MVNVQLGPWEVTPTVLTCVFIPCKDVQAIEADMGPWNPVKCCQGDHTGDLNGLVDEADGIISILGFQLAPAFEVECLILPVHSPGCPLVQEGEGSPDRRHVNGEKGTVQDQDICI